jgi:hypothetical protein
MDACGQEFLNKSCICLSDPLDPWSNLCGFIDRSTGLVYPCNTGCCVPRCPNMGQSQNLNIELHRTGGIALPAGFGSMLQNGGGTTGPGGGGTGGGAGAVPLENYNKKILGTTATPWLGASDPPPLKVWQKLAILAGFLLIVFLAAGFIDR